MLGIIALMFTTHDAIAVAVVPTNALQCSGRLAIDTIYFIKYNYAL